MLSKNEQVLDSLAYAPKNDFSQDPFSIQPDAFLNCLSQKLDTDTADLEGLYRFIPESFIASAIARAVCFYLDEVQKNKRVAFFVPESLHRLKNKLNSYALLLKTCSLLIKEHSGKDAEHVSYKELETYSGEVMLVEDAMYSGRELTFYIQTVFDDCRGANSVNVFLSTATKGSLRALPPETNLSVASLIPEVYDVAPYHTAQKLTHYFQTQNTFAVTAHKLPDTMSLHETGRRVEQSDNIVSMYPMNAVRKYPTAEYLAEKSKSLFYLALPKIV